MRVVRGYFCATWSQFVCPRRSVEDIKSVYTSFISSSSCLNCFVWHQPCKTGSSVSVFCLFNLTCFMIFKCLFCMLCIFQNKFWQAGIIKKWIEICFWLKQKKPLMFFPINFEALVSAGYLHLRSLEDRYIFFKKL